MLYQVFIDLQVLKHIKMLAKHIMVVKELFSIIMAIIQHIIQVTKHK